MKIRQSLHSAIIVGLFVKIYFIFLLINSQTNKKILSQGLLFSSIPASNFMVQNVYSKNKGKIKFILHQCKRLLNMDILTAWVRLTVKKPLFFKVLCRRGDFTSSKMG